MTFIRQRTRIIIYAMNFIEFKPIVSDVFLFLSYLLDSNLSNYQATRFTKRGAMHDQYSLESYLR